MNEKFMKKIKPEIEDWMRPEYKRSDLGEVVRGKYANTELEFSDLVRLILACIGEDENIQFTHHSLGNQHKPGNWTYEIDNAKKIILRYWLTESLNIEEPISNPTVVTNPNERAELQKLLHEHARMLKARVSES
jgi:hypothetical protein